jgi:hypothetical protein
MSLRATPELHHTCPPTPLRFGDNVAGGARERSAVQVSEAIFASPRGLLGRLLASRSDTPLIYATELLDFINSHAQLRFRYGG